MEKYADKLKDLLATEPTFTIEDKINKNYVASLARQYDKKLLELLSSDKDIAEYFFVDVDGSKVFKKDTFLAFINNKEFLPDSYTAFKSKIGLGTDADNYLSEDSRVVLNWPYKDCVLEGGQDKEDQKRNEVFFNEVLAPDQINTILDDKVFVNWKRYDKDGEHDLDELKPDDNLIIKGNNLVVLHSLKKRFAGKVKLIYIDPPYNTGNDGFKYNDHFNHSSWLTFMKNRLDAARTLIRDDGAIFVSCDDNEQAYLKVLMDEVFGRENFIATIPWRKRTAKSDVPFGMSQDYEWILAYAKTNKFSSSIESNSRKYYESKDFPGRPWRIHDLTKQTTAQERPNSFFTIVNPKDGKEYPANPNATWRITKETLPQYMADDRIVFPGDYDFLKISRPVLRYWKEDDMKKAGDKFGRTSVSTNLPATIGMSQDGTKENQQLFGEKTFSFPKPESLIAFLIDISTQPNDIVLDFCAGSGTTAAVAHKMGRQYIIVEQMGYIENTTVERINKVISGEQGGVSKAYNWTGGGSFVYCNIKNDANIFREKVRHADEKELEGLLDQVLKSSFLSYRVDPKKVSKKEFEKLSLADKKRVLFDLVDNNTLYLNYSEINDSTYNISEADKRHNKEFYGD